MLVTKISFLLAHFASSHQTWLHTFAQNWSPGDLSDTVVVILTLAKMFQKCGAAKTLLLFSDF